MLRSANTTVRLPLTPRLIAATVPEHVEDTYLVISEDGLWHRRQRQGVRFRTNTPLDVVLAFVSSRKRASRYDLQSLIDHLSTSVGSVLADLETHCRELAPGPWLEAHLPVVLETFSRVALVLRRSLAQARSQQHSCDLLDRHITRMSERVREFQNQAPAESGPDAALDLVHEVAGGIMQACELIRDDVLPLVWGR